MKLYIKIAIIVVLLSIMVFSLTGCGNNIIQKDTAKFNIVTSFYPINIMLLNITDGASEITLENMTDSQVGCLHEYTLKTQDLIKLEDADVLIQNGLGIETFTDKVTNLYTDLKIVDSSVEVTDIVEHNAHIWTSTSNYIQQVKYTANELSKLDNNNAELYLQNADAYINRILQAQERANNDIKIKAITFSEEFEYLAKENNIDLITIETHHEESALSAEKLASVIDKMKDENIKIILVNPNENTKNAQVIAQETGAKLYELDTYLTGKFDKNSYINSLNKNIEKINEMKQL